MAGNPDRLRAINRAAAVIIPLFLAGVVGYATWVLISLVCVQYFLQPRDVDIPRRRGMAIAFIVVYFVTLFLMTICYLRIIQVIQMDPGYVPQGRVPENVGFDQGAQQSHIVNGSTRRGASGTNSRSHLSANGKDVERHWLIDYDSIINGKTQPPPGLERFYSKDVFVCDSQGLPIWCPTCCCWKPDRTHHCSEIGRCTRRMDHFCPWVGGIVSETNMKFFIQFLCYAFLYTSFVEGVMAYAIVDRNRRAGKLDPNWIILIACGALFCLLATGMAMVTVRFAYLNLTTIENLSRDRELYLAVLVDRQTLGENAKLEASESGANGANSFTSRRYLRTITYPLVQERGPSSLERPYTGQSDLQNGTDSGSRISYSNRRTFAVISAQPSDNPWDLGPLENLRSILGNKWFDWLLPLRYSPCCDHNRGDSEFPMGPVVRQLTKEAGIHPIRSASKNGQRRRRKSSSKHKPLDRNGSVSNRQGSKNRSKDTRLGRSSRHNGGRSTRR